MPEINLSHAPRRPLRHTWSKCVGAGRANEALRADWQEQAAWVREHLGFESVRFHGLFHDDMFVYRDSYGGGFGPDPKLPEPVITFSYVDKVFDFLLQIGLRPFVELGFMPRGLATQHNTLFWWGAHCSPPSDMAAWAELVRQTVRHWVERYGIDKVAQWRFEVWNEPNLVPRFWTGTRSEYFELYRASVEAVKSVDERLKVGGPSTSVFVPDARYQGEYEDKQVQLATARAEDFDALDWRPVWITEFLDFCQANNLPVDFVTTHLYPTDFAHAGCGESVRITRGQDATEQDLRVLAEILAASPFADAEIHITEWSSSPSSRDFIHDSVFGAVYILRSYLRTRDRADSVSYWTFTDIFEEGGAGIGPLHGGFGVLSEHGVRKPTSHAFQMLNRLGDQVVAEEDGMLISSHSETPERVAGVFYNYPDGMDGASVAAADTPQEALAYGEVEGDRSFDIRVAGLRPGDEYMVESVRPGAADPLRRWVEMGQPINPTRDQLEVLRAEGHAVDRSHIEVDAQGTLEISLVLPPWTLTSIHPSG